MATCTSCGRTDEETIPVHRVYLVLPEGTPVDESTIEADAVPTVVDDDEDWCATCCDQFPHVRRA